MLDYLTHLSVSFQVKVQGGDQQIEFSLGVGAAGAAANITQKANGDLALAVPN